MRRDLYWLAAASALLIAMFGGETAFAQKQGGMLKVYHWDSPASMSIHEEATLAAEGPMMGVFNNIVMYRQEVPQNSQQSIMPDLATDWSWDEGKTQPTLRLRQGVKWHDGKPFTAKDVECTWNLLTGKSSDKLRVNPRKAWYHNLEEATTNGDFEVTFHPKRPQPAFLALLASGFSPVYPCHVSARDMRNHPIGTGPFKFLEFKQNESIKVTRNLDYWKKDRPYLDGIDYVIMKNVSTGVLAFVAGSVDLTSPYLLQVPVVRDVKGQAPQAICEVTPLNVNRTLIINRDAPPFDNPDLRRAMSLSLDRKAFVDILTEGKGDVGGVMQPPPEGLWGMSSDILKTLPGYDPDTQNNRKEARAIMDRLGYGPDKRLSIKVSARNIPTYRDAAVILIDQLKGVYIDGELELIDTVQWFPKIMRKDYTVGLAVMANGLDDPDQTLYEYFVCGAEGNTDGYCSPQLDQLIDEQSREFDREKRKQLVWAIERRLAQDAARPVLYHIRAGTCWQPYVRGFHLTVNSAYNGLRMEDVWLDK